MEINLEELVEHHGLCYDGPVYSFNIMEGKHGPYPVATLQGYTVALPTHLTCRVREVLNSATSVQRMAEGAVGFVIEPYEDEHGKHHTVRWTSR